jgi:LPXTG-site transpeptidase (sortase) family protein
VFITAKVDELIDSEYNASMIPRLVKTKAATLLPLFPARAMIVWFMGKLSLLLSLALLALPAVFAFDLMTDIKRTESGRTQDVTGTPPLASTTAGWSERPPTYVPVALRLGTLTPGPASVVPASGPARWASLALVGLARTATPVAVVRLVNGTATPPAAATRMSTLSGAKPAPDRMIPRSASTPTPTLVPTGVLSAIDEPLSSKRSTPAIAPSPTAGVDLGALPVQIQIPALRVKRSILELPRIRDPETGAWTQDLDVLFRKGGKDLVGHYERSAVPGQGGNTILVGHNYGRGSRGVFLKLGRLKRGREVSVVNAAGRTFTYRVTAVEKVPWRRRNAKELVRHAKLLAVSGPERLTLVTCGGANFQPFPVRIYVIAEPVRD